MHFLRWGHFTGCKATRILVRKPARQRHRQTLRFRRSFMDSAIGYVRRRSADAWLPMNKAVRRVHLRNGQVTSVPGRTEKMIQLNYLVKVLGLWVEGFMRWWVYLFNCWFCFELLVTPSFELWALNLQLSALSLQLFELWALSFEPWALSFEPWALSLELSAFSFEPSAFSFQLWAFSFELWLPGIFRWLNSVHPDV